MIAAKPVLKALAVVSAVACVGAFVAYRAGAFAARTPPDAAAFEDGAASDGEPASIAELPPDTFMYSSKSAPAFTPAPTPQKPPVYLGGSKSIVLTPATDLVPLGGAPKPSAAPPAEPNAPKP